MACALVPSQSSLGAAIAQEACFQRKSPIQQKIFLSSNEEGIDQVMENLFKLHLERGAYIGVSGLQNWHFIHLTNPDFALLVDRNQKVVDFHRTVIDLIKRAENRCDFIRQLKKVIQNDPDSFKVNFRLQKKGKPLKDVVLLEEEINILCSMRYGAFSNEFAFEKIKKLACQGKILAFPLDLTDIPSTARLQTLMKMHHVSASVMHISNVGDWLHDEQGCDNPDLQHFTANIRTLMNPASTYLIESTWFGYEKQKYLDYGHQIVAALLYPLGSRPYDPCIFRGSVNALEREDYFEATPRLPLLDHDPKEDHWAESSQDAKKPRLDVKD